MRLHVRLPDQARVVERVLVRGITVPTLLLVLVLRVQLPLRPFEPVVVVGMVGVIGRCPVLLPL